MTLAAKTNELPDALDRQRAMATFDRNLVVTAGAGTGKTTLLVDRLAHLLLRNPDPLQITDIVALTFTNKAANEMKQRLRERLQNYLEVNLQIEPLDEATEKTQREVEALIRLYQLSKDELDTRLHEALRNLERADIGTIHSFAATLLRLYPLEAGVDPQFHEDDGKQFERIFDEQWNLWLDQELSLKSSHADDWRRVLKPLTLEQIKELANSLCSETVDLAGGDEKDKAKPPAEALRFWLQGLLTSAAALIERHPEDRVNEKLVGAAHAIIQEYLNIGGLSETALADEIQWVSGHSINKSTQGWSESDADKAQNLVRAAKGLCRIDPALTDLVWQLLVPYVERFREIFVHEGFVSFDGLLIRARNLVRDHLRVREELKRKYRTILIDEFQDTDPIQYEILLYLAEQSGHSAKDWRAVKLSAGKVFVVGDPKQSIYAFRRADIEAYLEVIEKIIKAQGGMECRLTTNFRSDAAILNVVNGVFESLIQAQPGSQPSYIGIQPAPQRKLLHSAGTHPTTLPKVLVRKILAPNKEINAEKARRLEGESLAAWLKDEVLDRVSIVTAKGEQVRAQPKDVAILLRKLTDIHDYLEPLRRQGIRYVVEGERHFYAAKEIIDTVNLLRAIENPHDRLAMVGVLRSPLGALTDQNIYDLHCQDLLDYRHTERLGGKNVPPALAELYRNLAKLHDDCRTLPVGEAVSHIFATLPLKPLAACYFHGEQAVANLEKLRQQAELLGREGGTMTFKQAIRKFQERVLDVKEEGESVLAEENVDAVRIMSIHKSKGLEFPIVVLAGCHTGIDGRQTRMAEALFDWSSGLMGLCVGPFTNLAGLYIAEKNRLRAEEEQKRVFYVAMTRAREHLVISSGPSTQRSSGNFISMLDQPLNDAVGSAEESTVVAIGAGELQVDIVEASLTAPGRAKIKRRRSGTKRNWQPYVELWMKRRQNYEAALSAPAFVTPTLLKREEQEVTEGAEPPRRQSHERTPAMVIGELSHRFLENWDFKESKKAIGNRLDLFLADWLPREFQKDAVHIRSELATIFERFANSDIYAELAKARILGREVPLLMPWDHSIMEGVIDLIYEHNGLLYLADYKTDRIERKDLRTGPQRYRHQAEIYSRAARQSLNREVAAFKLIFLRLGETVEVDLNSNKELWLF
jgi:ATP-dependent helicase/nuclease subunit A